MARALFTPRWIITTLLVITAVGVMLWLGFWQLERLEQRREFNQRVQAQIDAPPLDLNESITAEQLYAMEYRQVVVKGEYDPHNEILLRNQVFKNRPGYHLLTPLRIAGSQYSVLVDRGFIPMDQANPEQRAQYVQPGVVELRGMLRRPNLPRYFGVPDPTLAPGDARLDAWNAVNIERIQQQSPYPLLPVYLEAEPGPAEAIAGASAEAPEGASVEAPEGAVFPVAQPEQPDLSEGSHMGYALQWFAFAAILGIGYPFFLRKQLS